MKSSTRQKFAFLALGGVVASGFSLLVLRVGRPIYYTDGQSARSAIDLRHASMLQWSTPAPEVELAGPVQGRVATLPDGRLIYGRRIDPQRTDLVVLDPRRPGLEPEVPPGLNAAGHDLAPAVAADGRLYFASDRKGGSGGFDIWSARIVGRSIVDVRNAGPLVNSEQDETDPAPHPRDDRLVFVRRDPTARDGRNGTMMIVAVAGDDAPRPLLPVANEKAAWIDRDPAFSPDGASVWFARQSELGELSVQRTWEHARAGWVSPVTIGALGRARRLRGPDPTPGGFGLRLVGDGIVYESRAFEVYPWWEGQRTLELVLLSFLLFSTLLLLLLTLGGRWQQLDIITQCLLISMLVHLLLLLWLMRVELVRRFELPPPREGNAVEVRLLSGSERAARSGRELTQTEHDVSRDQLYQASPRPLDAEAPAQAMTAADRDTPEAARSDRTTFAMSRAQPVRQTLQDAAAELARRSGEDRRTPLDAQPARAAQERQPADRARKTIESADAITVEVPWSAPDRAEAGPAARVRKVAPAPREDAVAVPRALSVRPVAVHDRPLEQKPPRAAKAEPLPPARLDRDLARIEAERVSRAHPEVGKPIARRAAATVATAPRGLAQNLDRAGPRQAPGPDRHAGHRPTMPAPDLGLADEPADRVVRVGTAAANGSRLAPRASEVRADPLPLPHAPSKEVAHRPALRLGRPTSDLGRPGSVPARPAAAPRQIVARAFAPSAEVADPVPDARAGPARRSRERALAAAPAPVTPDIASEEMPIAAPQRPPDPARARAGEIRLPAPRLPAATRASAPRPPIRHPPRAMAQGASPAEPTLRDQPVPTEAAPHALAEAAPRAELEAAAPPAIEGPVAAPLDRPERDRLARSPRSGALRLPPSFVERAARRKVATPAPREVATKPSLPSFYANRFGDRKTEALERFGGSKETERAVQLGLRYLASIQREDGSWGAQRKWHRKYGEVYVGKTGLAVLAFLGAGHTPQSKTLYSNVVSHAIEFLLELQGSEGHFGVTSSYSHGITTYALAECYAMTKAAKLRRPLELALEWTLRNQNMRGARHSRGGWGYFSSRLQPEDRYARASTTAWQVMALESARRSGLEIPDRALAMARRFLLNCWDDRYDYFLYNREPSRLSSHYRTLPASTPASIFCLILLGVDPSDSRLERGLEFTVDRKPRRYRRVGDDEFVERAAGNVYFWYYGSLACFFAGGEVWKEWNEALKTLLPRAQDENGSFAPIDPYAEYAGDRDDDRVYTTAMCILSLEVYYRYFTPLLVRK